MITRWTSSLAPEAVTHIFDIMVRENGEMMITNVLVVINKILHFWVSSMNKKYFGYVRD